MLPALSGTLPHIYESGESIRTHYEPTKNASVTERNGPGLGLWISALLEDPESREEERKEDLSSTEGRRLIYTAQACDLEYPNETESSRFEIEASGCFLLSSGYVHIGASLSVTPLPMTHVHW